MTWCTAGPDLHRGHPLVFGQVRGHLEVGVVDRPLRRHVERRNREDGVRLADGPLAVRVGGQGRLEGALHSRLEGAGLCPALQGGNRQLRGRLRGTRPSAGRGNAGSGRRPDAASEAADERRNAGNLHVRFDERRLETELRRGVRHRHRRKAAGNSYPLCLPPPRQSSTLLDRRRGRTWLSRGRRARQPVSVVAALLAGPGSGWRAHAPSRATGVPTSARGRGAGPVVRAADLRGLPVDGLFAGGAKSHVKRFALPVNRCLASVFSGQVDVFPAEPRDVNQEFGRGSRPTVSAREPRGRAADRATVDAAGGLGHDQAADGREAAAAGRTCRAGTRSRSLGTRRPRRPSSTAGRRTRLTVGEIRTHRDLLESSARPPVRVSALARRPPARRRRTEADGSARRQTWCWRDGRLMSASVDGYRVRVHPGGRDEAYSG